MQRNESPILTFGKNSIWRATSRNAECEQRMFPPYVVAIGIHSKRQIKIEPAALSSVSGRSKLLLGDPLNVHVVAFILFGKLKPYSRRLTRCAWPLWPRYLKVLINGPKFGIVAEARMVCRIRLKCIAA